MTALVTWADRPSVVSYSPVRQMCGSASRVPSEVGGWAPSIRSHWATMALISVGLKQHPHWNGYGERERERQRGRMAFKHPPVEPIRCHRTRGDDKKFFYTEGVRKTTGKKQWRVKLQTSAHCLKFQDFLTNKRGPSALAWELAWGGRSIIKPPWDK